MIYFDTKKTTSTIYFVFSTSHQTRENADIDNDDVKRNKIEFPSLFVRYLFLFLLLPFRFLRRFSFYLRRNVINLDA